MKADTEITINTYAVMRGGVVLRTIVLRVIRVLAIVTFIYTYGCADQPDIKDENSTTAKEDHKMKNLDIKSNAFAQGDTIPVKYTCDGINISAPLSWSDPPEGAESLALICDDPDAPRGTWVHWVLFNMPPGITGLSEGIAVSKDKTTEGAIEGINDFGNNSYGGPCPPPGAAHRYYFKIYALDKKLDLTSKATKADIEAAMTGHILAKGQLMGKYKR
jgi:Raf kinase inhibitor-like YbhB/YbcL family protein